MLFKSIDVADPMAVHDHVGVPVVGLRLPVTLSRAEMVAALFMTVPFSDDPYGLSAGDLDDCLASAVLWEGVAAIHRMAEDLAGKTGLDPGAAELLALCERFADQQLTPNPSLTPAQVSDVVARLEVLSARLKDLNRRADVLETASEAEQGRAASTLLVIRRSGCEGEFQA